MTDHKPLSEGEIPYEMVDAAAYELRAEFKITLGREPPHLSIAQVMARAVLRKAFAATPKPLDGEAGKLRQRIEHQIQAFKISGKPYHVDLVRLLADCEAAISLPAQTCEATKEEIEAAFAEGVGGLSLGISGSYVVAVLAKAGLHIVKEGAPTSDQFNAGIEAAAQLLALRGMPGWTGLIEAVRGAEEIDSAVPVRSRKPQRSEDQARNAGDRENLAEGPAGHLAPA